MKTLDGVKLKDLLPDSIAQDGNVKASAEAIDPHLKFLAENSDIPSIYINIDKLNSLALDHLARQYDISVWRDGWNVSLKRSVLKTAISDKRKKGTVGAVKEALKSLGSAASIVEWWQTSPKGEPHTFTIYVTQPEFDGVIPAEMQEDIIGMIDDAKPLRSHYNFIISQVIGGGVGVYGCVRALAFSSVRSVEAQLAEVNGELGMVAASRAISKRHLILTA